MFSNRLKKVYRHLHRQAKRLGVTCYRIYNADLPEFPFCIERYADKLYVAEYKRRHPMTEEQHESWLQQCMIVLQEVLSVAPENIFLKLRQRKPGRLGQYQKQGDSKSEFVVEENGLKFIVNLSDYLDTGLFLDHRTTRAMVKEGAANKSVLNLFAYTGSFSVYAAAGGAGEVVTVDLSKTYLQWAERNLNLNGFFAGKESGTSIRFLQKDVMQYLPEVAGASFDIIVMDPPTFSNSKRMDGFLDIQRDHVKLINECLRILRAGGQLYFSTNFSRFVLEAGKIDKALIKNITKETTPFDFTSNPGRVCFLIKKQG
jgi:23S rRNA (cytosine1962-C5)-methyltransferase